MKVLDVHAFESGIDEINNKIMTLSTQLSLVEKSVNELIHLSDAFKGEGPQAILTFFEQYHKPLLNTYLTFCSDYKEKLLQMKQALFSFEPASNGLIRQSFLEVEVDEGITRAEKVTKELTTEANGIMDSVSDIVTLPHLKDDGVVIACRQARQYKQNTIDRLVELDRSQTDALTTIESTLLDITNQIQFMKDIFIQDDSSVDADIAAVQGLSCEIPESSIKEKWYDVGIIGYYFGQLEGIILGFVDIFKGLFDMLYTLFTDPIGYYKNLLTVMFNPIDTITEMWNAVETAWERDVINGNARSRGSFVGYALASIFGLKGIDKVAKVGKAGKMASKTENTIPYNTMDTNYLKDSIQRNLSANMQQKPKQYLDLLKSNLGKETVNKIIDSLKNLTVITNARNILEPNKIKVTSNKIYKDVVKAPIAKTQEWMQKKKEQILNAPMPNFGPIPLGPSLNMTVRDGFDEAKDHLDKIVGGEKGKVDGKDKFLQKDEGINIVKEISPEDRKKLEGWKYPPSDEKYLKYKEVYDNKEYYNQETGEVIWPPNNGFDGEIDKKYELQVGEIIDRYGNPDGNFLSPAGTPYEQRALALHSDEAPYHKYMVLVPFEVEAGKILPWFDRIGGGTQYYTTKVVNPNTGESVEAKVKNLIDLGYIEEIE